MTIIFKKSFLQSKEVKQFVRKSRLDEFKRRILEHLSKLEAKEKKKDESVQKALVEREALRKAGYPVGTVREWKGKKYMKVAPNKWKRKYDKEERGAKLSVAAIKRKVNAATTGDELLDIVLENRDRFKDENGRDLPIVQELMDYVSEARKKLSGGGAKGASGKAEGGEKAKGKKAAAESGKQASGEGKEEKPAVVRSPGIMKIRAKYEASPSIEGNDWTVVLANGKEVECHYRIVEADAPTASHDETSFSPTAGFPTNEDGSTINDRDYRHDESAQDMVRSIADNFDARAIGNPPIVTKDGIVVSGNNRTMSSKLAARNGTDAKYIESLRKRAKQFGISPSDLDGFKNPRLILEINAEHEGDYTTQEFAAYNQDDKKAKNNVEKAVTQAKTLGDYEIKKITSFLENFESMGDLYKKGGKEFVKVLIDAGVLLDNEKAQYLTGDGQFLNDTGKDFAETVLVGLLLNEDNIRHCDVPGGKSIRKKLVRALLPLAANKGDGKFSFNAELNEATALALKTAKNHSHFENVRDFLKQNQLFEDKRPSEIVVRLAEALHDDTELKFAKKMRGLCAALSESDSGYQGLDFDTGENDGKGNVAKKNELMMDYLSQNDIKKAVAAALQRAFGNLGKSA